MLAQQYEALQWDEAAAELYETILQLSPGDKSAIQWLESHSQWSKKPVALPQPSDKPRNRSSRPKFIPRKGGLAELEAGYRTLLTEADVLVKDLLIFQDMCSTSLDLSGHISDLKAISEGRIASVVNVKPPPAVRATASKIRSSSSQAVNLACADLEAYTRWIRSREESSGDDWIRDAVRKRADAIKAALTRETGYVIETAFMHVEHEVLGKTYQNGTETMLGDAIAAIPRDSFWTSEDGYAWDMSELEGAIRANKGVMRNPLSKQMFTADDVQAIVRHPMGKSLAALQLEQQQLINGVREETINKLEAMANTLLADQSADAAASREAVDAFLVHQATLPEMEQTALDRLRVPATDSHTGQTFDVSIGEAIADAKANRQCMHKTGDHMRQAALHLRSKGKASSKVPGAWQ